MRLIRKKIIQSWKSKTLPPLIQKNVEQIKELNPSYEYELSDDEDCRKFLAKHFGHKYVKAFNEIIPGAFKCDFWRYAKLYIEGGIYLDLDMYPEVSFDEIIRDGDQFVSVVDRKKWHPPCAIYQAFIACIPKHPILKYALDLCLENIENHKQVGDTGMLDITGPVVMGRAFNIYWTGKNTLNDISPGIYGPIRLFYNREDDSTIDLQGRILFNNKVDGYMNVAVNYYGKQNTPLYVTREKRKKSLWILLTLVILIFGILYVYKKK